MDIFGILDPDPHENLCGSETLVFSTKSKNSLFFFKDDEMIEAVKPVSEAPKGACQGTSQRAAEGAYEEEAFTAFSSRNKLEKKKIPRKDSCVLS